MKLITSLRWPVAGTLLISLALGGCADQQFGEDPDDYYGHPGTTSVVSDPIEFTDEPYDFSGEMPIGDLRAMVPSQEEESVWYGFSPDDPYPVEGDCNPELDHIDTIPEELSELPATIEGIVTLHPRYFENFTMCGSRERYFGTYVLQDETSGIQVLKDSRVAEFDVGDRVSLRVRGVGRHFGTVAVTVFDNEEVLNERDERYAVYYEEIDREFDVEIDNYEVRRITGVVVSEATNQNFNEMLVQSIDDPDVEWFVSIDRELGTRGVAPPLGSLVELTGPVVDSFELRMLIATLGQINVLEEVYEEEDQ
jgi:hypothetical protein